MAYCSAQDVRNALNPDGVNAGSNTAADISDPALEDAAEQASAIIDAYIDGPYDPGNDTVPAIIRYWARDIGAYLASLTWRRSKAPAPNNPVVLRYNDVLTMLQKYADGELSFPGPSNVEDQPTVINPLPGPLIGSGEFDLHGREEGVGGWPLFIAGGIVYWHDWAGYP